MQRVAPAQRVNRSSDESSVWEQKPHPRTASMRKLCDSNPASWSSSSSSQAAVSLPAHPSPPTMLSSTLHAQSLAYSLGQLSWSLPSSAPNPSWEALGSSWQMLIPVLM